MASPPSHPRGALEPAALDAEREIDGLDFDAETEGPDADADLADTGAEPDAEGDFDADA